MVLYLRDNISFKTSILCTGAAIAFLTKRQAPINEFIDKYISKQDLKMAYDPKMLWVIISLDANGIKEVRAYRIIESLANFQEIPLFISTNHQSNK